jgi:hypothetical protein
MPACIARTIGIAMFASVPAFAGMGGSMVPSFPTPLTVGDTKTATITLINRSTAPNNDEDVNVSAIFLTPSCASSNGITCLALDPGVFELATIIGKSGTSCASTVFTAGPADPASGAFELIAPVNRPVVLGPANGSGPKPSQCVILINFRVLRVPQDSTPPDLPLTTDSLGRATLRGAVRGNTGAATGGNTTAISGNGSSPTVDLSITVTNGVAVIQ